MALDSTSTRARSITAIGAGAVLFAVVGFLFLNKKKPRNKKSKQEAMQPVTVEPDLKESLTSPVEASSPIGEQKFFHKSEIFEISIEKSTEKSLILDLDALKQLEQRVPEEEPAPEVVSNSSTDMSNSSLTPSSSSENEVKEVKEDPPKPVKIIKKPQPKKSKSTNQVKPVSKTEGVEGEKNFEDLVVYEFNFPRKLCGKLIGKNGVHVDFIRSKTHTQIAVRNDPKVEEQQIVCVSGILEDVDHALDIIRARFPGKHYPQVSFKPISKPIIYRRYNTGAFNSPKVLVAPNMYVDVKSVQKQNDLVDVYVSSIVSPTHVFVQLPKNSTFMNLQKLDQNMLGVYNNTEETVPVMAEPIEYGSICAAPTSYGWHRAMVTSYMTRSDVGLFDPDFSEQCGLATVKFLDYGGYLDIPANQLRQLRSDFMVLPFQALECYLDGLCPYEGTEESGKQFLTEIVRSSTLKAKITECYEGQSALKLYLYNDLYDGLDINSELVNNNFAFNYNETSKSAFDDSQQQIVPQSI